MVFMLVENWPLASWIVQNGHFWQFLAYPAFFKSLLL